MPFSPEAPGCAVSFKTRDRASCRVPAAERGPEITGPPFRARTTWERFGGGGRLPLLTERQGLAHLRSGHDRDLLRALATEVFRAALRQESKQFERVGFVEKLSARRAPQLYTGAWSCVVHSLHLTHFHRTCGRQASCALSRFSLPLSPQTGR